MEGADQVLAVGGVDAGLAADGGIDLREQRGRHLHEAHAAADDRGGKAGEVADDAAAERDDEIAALDLRGEDRVADAGRAGHRISRSRPAGTAIVAARNPRPSREAESALGVERPDGAVGDDGRGAGAEGGDTAARLGEKAAADEDVVGAPRQRHRHGRHARRSSPRRRSRRALRASRAGVPSGRLRTSSTTRSCGASRDSTVMSASP